MFDWVLNTPLYYLFSKAHRISLNRPTKSFFLSSSVIIKNSYRVILTQQIHNPKRSVKEQSNTTQVTESDSSNCNFRDTLIVPVRGLFHGIHFFYLSNREYLAACRLNLAAFRFPYFVDSADVCNTNEIMKQPRLVYIFKKSIKKLHYSFFEKVISLVISLVFTEEIAFKHFLLINITNFRFFYFLVEILTST